MHGIRDSIAGCSRGLKVAHAMRNGKLLALCPRHHSPSEVNLAAERTWELTLMASSLGTWSGRVR